MIIPVLIGIPRASIEWTVATSDHLHCRHDYRLHGCRVLCNARGHGRKGEADGYDGQRLIDVFDTPA